VAVGALLDENKGDAVDWLKTVLSAAISERKSWEAEEEARLALEAEAAGLDSETAPQPSPSNPPFINIKPDNEARQTALLKDAKLRLLLTTLKFEKLDATNTLDTRWIIPSQLTSIDLQTSLELLKLNADNPPTFPDGQLAEDFISRKPKPRAQVFDSDSDSGLEPLFEPGGPTPMPGAEKPTKKPTKKRRRKDAAEFSELGSDLDDAAIERALKRRQKEKERLAMIKSSLFVHDSDDESDEERDKLFYEKERMQRAMGPVALDGTAEPQLDFMEYGFGGVGEDWVASVGAEGENRRKRKNVAGGQAKTKKRRAIESGSDDDDRSSVDGGKSDDDDDDDDGDSEEQPFTQPSAKLDIRTPPARPRRRGLVIVSSDEE